MILGKGAIKKIKITHNGLQLLYNAQDNKINKNPDARNADRNMILFNGFISVEGNGDAGGAGG